MNYAGKFDAQLPADGPGLHSNVHLETVSPRATHAPSDAIVVPDAHLLFNAEFKRSGVDLILSSDSQELVLHDYFKGEKRAALASPDGAHLTGDVVNALAGHVEYAQADGSAAAGHVIGHVTKLVGTATAIRNGVSIILNNGDNVEKGDVVQSGSDSTLGITFIDGTVFGLSSNARMVLNEMVYDPNGSNNSSLLSLVAGTISFVAGETAKHGDMKVDTPVATMGIRGTAVLVEIDFDVPGQNGVPDAKFQVLVEPDGTTGSYILFDKTTLTPLAVVDKAGQQINISNGILSQTTNPLSPEIQKLITDVFSLKFSDNSNTKTLDHFTDTIIPLTLEPIKLANGVTATPVVLVAETPAGSPTNSGNSPANIGHIGRPPSATSLSLDGQLTTSFQTSELAGKTADTVDFDAVSGRINFVDINLGDRPTVSSKFESFVYKGAQGNVLSLNAQQKADVAALELKLTLKPDPGNLNFGTVLWTYNDPASHLSVPDKAFDFLAAGETLQLTYWLTVDNNYAPSDQTTTLPITITITGTNDVPVITTAQQEIHFVGGKTTQGGFLTTNDSSSGTLAFADPDLTDTHTIVSTNLTSASLLLGGKTLDKAALDQDFPAVMKAFESALSASVTTDSTGTGTGTISWQLAKLSAFLADIVPNNETLVLDYTVEVKDSQGAIATKIIEVQIKGNDTPAVVWVETVEKGSTAPGDWNDGSNWETGIVPTASDDAIIITDQLIGQTPVYPVTVKAGEVAAAKSVAMNDFNDNTPATLRPELDIELGASLTIGDGGLSLNADAILRNFGTLSVGSLASLLGKAELAGQSVLNNSGHIKLYQGGDFKDSSSITNSSTIEVAGGALDVQVDIANSGGVIQVDDGQTLTLSGAEIIGGTINDSSLFGTGGFIVVTGDSKIDGGASLNKGAVTVESGKTLTFDNVTVTGATFTDTASGAVIQVDDGTTLTISGVTIDGGTVNDGTAGGTGSIDVTGSSIISDALLNNGAVTVESGVTLTLDNVTVTGTTFTDTASGAVIQVDDGTTLTISGVTVDGGTVNDGTAGGTGSIDVTGSSKIDGNALLNNGTVTVESGVTLTLDNVTVNGTVFNDLVTGSTIQIDSGDTLAFNGATINGGTLKVLGEMDSTGSSFINGATIVNVANIIVVSGTLTIDPTPVSNTGTIEVKGGSTLVLSDDIITNTDGTTKGTIQVDAIDSTHFSTLDLKGSTISGGTLIISGELDSTGDSFITGVTITNTGTIDVTGGTLIIDATSTLDNTGRLESDGGNLIIDTSFSGSLEIKGGAMLELGADSPYASVTVTFAPDATGTLKLDHAETFGGTVVGLDDNKIDLVDIKSVMNEATVLPTVTFDSATDILTITSNVDPTEVAHIKLQGDYTGVTWDVTTDGNGGTDITEVPGVIAGLVNGNATEGSAIKASITDGGAAVTTATYTWQIFENGVWDPGSGVADLNGNYTPGEADEGHALRVSISFVDALNHSETAIVSAGTVIGVPETPVVSTPDAKITTENHAAIALTGLSVTPADASANAAADTFNVTLSVNDGSLALASHSGLNGTFSGASITFSGSLADVNAALAGVSYTPTSEFEGQDTLTFSSSTTEEADAGGGTSAAATQTASITVNPVAEAGTAVAPATLTLDENAAGVAITGVVVGPLAEDSDDSVSAALTVGHGTLHVDDSSLPPGVTVTGDDSGSLTISGDAAAVNTLLAGLTYTPTGEYEGADQLNLSVTSKDGASTSATLGTASTAITVNPVAEAGTASAPPTLTLDENATGVAITGVIVGPLAEDSDDSVSAALTVGHGTLHVGTLAGVTVTGNDSSSLTISGDAAAVNARLAGLTYTPVTEFNGSDSLHVTVTSKDGSDTSATLGTASTAITVKDGPNDLVATLDHTTAQQGVTMHVTGVTDGGIAVTTGLSYQWQDSSNNGQTWQTVSFASSYTPGESDEGKLMQLVVTYVDAGGSESSTYSLGMPNDLTATLDSTTAQQGLAIHVTGVKDGGSSVSQGVSYAWQVSADGGQHWTTEGTNSSYTPTAGDAGDLLQVVVTYADSGEHESVTDSLGIVAAAKEWKGGYQHWQTADKWNSSGAPTASDNALVDVSGQYTVKIDHDATAHSLVVNDSGAKVEIFDNHTLTLGGNLTVEAGNVQIDFGATLKDTAASATISGSVTDYGTIEAAGGAGSKLEIASTAISGFGHFKIDAGAILQLDHADSLDVAFAGSGELILKDPTHFTGVIYDSTGSLTVDDKVDLAGFDTTATVSYFGATWFGIVRVSESNHATVNLLVGANSTHWSVTGSDGNGGILIHDPPADTSDGVAGVVMQDPGPAASSTIVASAPNQTLSGLAASDTFVFNFAGVGHDTVTNFHPATDTLQFSGTIFANVQAALNAAQDDGHGNTVIALDAHDTITLSGVHKAQLQVSDFHVV